VAIVVVPLETEAAGNAGRCTTVALVASGSEEKTQSSSNSVADPDADVQASRGYEFAAKVGSKAAWTIFLTKNPSGFHADLVKAQLATATATSAPAAAVRTTKKAAKGTKTARGGGGLCDPLATAHGCSWARERYAALTERSKRRLAACC
jgi:hypothetical protein